MRNGGLSGEGWIVLLFVCLFSSFSTAQDTLTGSSMNGRGWKTLGNCKVVFLMGFEDGMFGGLIIGRPDATYPEINKLYAENTSKLTHAEIISEIDKFYEEASNVLIPVHAAHGWVIQKIKGATPDDLQKQLVRLRQVYNK
jgi:hypothetical protein